MKIKIVDYGMGNLRSVQKAFEKIGADAEICQSPDELKSADKIVLPGVGAFRDAIHELRTKNHVDVIKQHIEAERPFLGICLGLQLLFDTSYEDGEFEGLGIIPGEVVRFDNAPDLKIPHMGWNLLDRKKENPLLEGIPEDAHFYFVHSYYVAPKIETDIATETEHGNRFCSMISRGNLFATQFHPEKSQSAGLRILKNFASL